MYRKWINAALFVALTAICAQMIFALPFSPVPLSLSVIPVFLAGGLLDKRQAVLAMCVYLLLGGVGAPVFSGFSGGLQKLFGPTGGYLLAYPLMTLFIALCKDKMPRSLALSGAMVICYAMGTVWLAFTAGMGIGKAFLAGTAPFILFDVLKIALCAWLLPQLQRRLPQE